jgi:hypothetical protein
MDLIARYNNVIVSSLCCNTKKLASITYYYALTISKATIGGGLFSLGGGAPDGFMVMVVNAENILAK